MDKGKKVCFIVRGKQLVDNASQRLFSYGIDHGVLQGNHWNYKPQHKVQLCSIDTLYRRKIIPEADLIVLDETHNAVSESFRWVISHYDGKFILGVTATPHVKGGLRHIADHVVYPITLKELIEQGYLVQPKYFAPSKVDLGKVRTDSKTGDYNLADLSAVYDENVSIFGDVIKSYKQHLNGLPSVIFAINKEHSKHLEKLFSQAGFTAVHIEDSTSMSRRAEVMAGLEDGSINVVCNVGIWTVGVDIPCLRGIVMVRPTQSYNLHIQMVGRATRPYPNKDHFIVLDHANNISRHGFIECERECDLDGKPSLGKNELQPIICEQCYGAFQPEGDKICHHCGHDHKKERDKVEREVVHDASSYELKEVTPTEFQKFELNNLITNCVARGYKIGWIYHRMEHTYGEARAKELWPEVKKEAARRLSEKDNPRNQSSVRPLLAQRNR